MDKKVVISLADAITELMNDCPHFIDQATIPSSHNRTEEEVEILREKQEVWQYSIGYKRIKRIKSLLNNLDI